ncbi:MAG: LytTR family DNA-binding domain-containing protein [Bacteroidota bacterium]
MSASVTCLIVDDEPLARDIIQSHVEQFPQLEVIASCQHALEAFEILKNRSIDLIFLDIQMPVMTGIEFVRNLPQPPAIIFTTAYRDYAVESYELDVIDYLLKPISFSRFFKAVNKFLDTHLRPPAPVEQSIPPKLPDHLFLNVNKKHVKVRFAEIQYVESLKDYIRIHLEGGTVVTKERITVFAQKLPEYFLRIHRSFIVNTQKISAYTAQDVEIGAKEIPIGGSYRSTVAQVLSNQA